MMEGLSHYKIGISEMWTCIQNTKMLLVGGHSILMLDYIMQPHHRNC